MSDRAEQAFRDAFAEHADVELGAVESRRRRRGPLPWLAAAVVVLVALGVPMWLLLGGDRGDVATPATTTTAPATSEQHEPTLSGLPVPKDGWRWVSRFDLAVQVPEDWGYSRYSWMVGVYCADGQPSPPVVPERPFVSTPPGVIPAIQCPPIEPEWVQTHLDWYPDPATPDGITEVMPRKVGTTTVAVTLTADPTEEERTLAQEVVDSAVVFERDQAGCTPTSPIDGLEARPEPSWDVSDAGAVLALGLCRYDDLTAGTLTGSRLVEGAAAAALVEAIAAAPEGTSGDPSQCAAGYGERSGVVLHVLGSDGIRDIFFRVDGCRQLGFDDGTTRRQVTAESCRPVFAEEPIGIDSTSIDHTLCQE